MRSNTDLALDSFLTALHLNLVVIPEITESKKDEQSEEEGDKTENDEKDDDGDISMSEKTKSKTPEGLLRDVIKRHKLRTLIEIQPGLDKYEVVGLKYGVKKKKRKKKGKKGGKKKKSRGLPVAKEFWEKIDDGTKCFETRTTKVNMNMVEERQGTILEFRIGRHGGPKRTSVKVTKIYLLYNPANHPQLIHDWPKTVDDEPKGYAEWKGWVLHYRWD